MGHAGNRASQRERRCIVAWIVRAVGYLLAGRQGPARRGQTEAGSETETESCPLGKHHVRILSFWGLSAHSTFVGVFAKGFVMMMDLIRRTSVVWVHVSWPLTYGTE